MTSRWNPDLCCMRCKRPILSDNQVCRWKGQVWPCVRRDDPSVFEAPVGGGTLKIKVGRGDVPRAPILDDPYEND